MITIEQKRDIMRALIEQRRLKKEKGLVLTFAGTLEAIANLPEFPDSSKASEVPEQSWWNKWKTFWNG